ncbi:uncharacterized protein LOC108108461 [Drosophila eugracilis]|uniref:uncharacterized protein LOC108108461 n=1 Tax=Drosophila eugracilis TaxID=29029 RepID=UPI0007E84741|nr:uncharacterized protein LOC108108461 [Drosophila eugracilis]
MLHLMKCLTKEPTGNILKSSQAGGTNRSRNALQTSQCQQPSNRDGNRGLKLSACNLSPPLVMPPTPGDDMPACYGCWTLIKSPDLQAAHSVEMFANNGKLLPAFGLCLGLLISYAAGQAQNVSKESASWKPMQPQKRQAIVKLDPLGSAAAKSYDPPPEFYRGPGSSSSKLDNTAASFISKPIGSLPPAGGSHGSQISSLNENLSEAYDKWRLGGNIHDRISVGHYSSSGSAGKSYAYESHPYPYDYGTSNGHGYDTGPAPGHGYSSSGEAGVPYHLYRPRPEHAHYPGPPVDYSYSSYPIDSHEIVSHKGSPELSPKALLAKSFLIPLASATVLGIAAALVSNPLLLQLAPVPGIGVGVGVGPTVVGKRRRRRQTVKRVLRLGES